MYTLVWDRHGFDVRHERLNLTPPVPGHAQPLAISRAGSCSVDYDQWLAFTRTGKGPSDHMDSLLRESWRRCRELEVDPGPRKCWNFLPQGNLEPSASKIRELTREVEHDVYSCIREHNLLLTITNSDGHVVRTCGNPSTLKDADKLNFGPGALWSEESVGTNAIGTALATGKPIQVFGREHYCESHHGWSCSAAPFFDPLGSIVGCFDISGPCGEDHSLALSLVLDAVRLLEKRLFQQHCAELEHRSCALVTAAFNSVLTGMISIDSKGCIIEASMAAEALLGLPGRSLKGRAADSIFDYDSFLARHKDGTVTTIPLICRTKPALMAKATPLYSMNGTWVGTVVAIMEPQRMQREVTLPASHAAPQTPAKGLHRILGQSLPLQQAVALAARAARTPSTVLLTGESGTGKELFARGIHEESSRANGPFVAVNCGAMAPELIQSELFGYVGGSFTGADRKGRPGKFELADKGTLFLDEIGEMPLSMQVNLLRVLEERRVVRVGGSKETAVDVKIIAATNKDLEREAAQGRFRADLLYRLNVVRIQIPPLRERAGDIDVLALAHAARLAKEYGLAYERMEPAALKILRAHSWPGNVRELINALEHGLNAMEGRTLRPEHLPAYLQTCEIRVASAECMFPGSLRDKEAELIRTTLEKHDYNMSRTAKELGIGRNTLYAKLRRLGISA